MEIGKTLYVTDRGKWRAWLTKHFRTEKEIWLVFPKKASGKDRLSYNDAVEEALCFGWIDSIVKSLDEESTAQRFSPRKPGSPWSQPNKERLRGLAEHGKLHQSVATSIQHILTEIFVFPADILAVIRKNKKAWKNYQKFSPAYQRVRIAYIDDARARPEEFEKRLRNLIAKTEQNKQIGFGGIEKYY